MKLICGFMDHENKQNAPHSKLKIYVKDRLGHDKRYAINYGKIHSELNWFPKYNFSESLLSTTIKFCLKY